MPKPTGKQTSNRPSEKQLSLANKIETLAEELEYYLQHDMRTTSQLDVRGLRELTCGAVLARRMHRQVNTLRMEKAKATLQQMRRESQSGMEEP